MAITYFEKERIFKLDTPASSYVIGIVDKENFVGHVHPITGLVDKAWLQQPFFVVIANCPNGHMGHPGKFTSGIILIHIHHSFAKAAFLRPLHFTFLSYRRSLYISAK